MTKILDNLARMGAAKTKLRLKRFTPLAQGGSTPGVLETVESFGRNPGNLVMRRFIPDGLPADAALVVVLHGCQQDAPGYDAGTGWSELAARHGFALLYPSQQTANNPMNCFKWYDPSATARVGGEAESILAMVAHMLRHQTIAPNRVFITGLSAGGAMAAALLASAPDIFAGGAIIAGLPHGAASSVPEALQAMRSPPSLSAADWGAKVRAAHPHRGRRPSVSIWHGTGDSTVAYANAEANVAQWSHVLELSPRAYATERGPGHVRQVWRDGSGEARLELWSVDGMAHGTPIAPGSQHDAHRIGAAAPFILDADLASTWHIADGWGLLETPPRAKAAPIRPAAAGAANVPSPPEPAESGVMAVINKALRDAGLLK